MHRRSGLLVILASLAVHSLAQNVNSLLLPDQLDSRSTTARVNARISELQAESALQTALGNPGAAANIDAVVAYIQSLLSGASTIPAATMNEIHAVSFYEGAAGVPNTATVQVTRTGSPVTLFLNAYDPITWTIAPLAPGVQLAQIVVVSYDPQVLNGVPPGVPVQIFDLNSGGTYYGQPDDLEGRIETAAECVTRFGVFPITFTGSYTAPAGAHEVGPGSSEWREQWILGYALSQVQTLCTATTSNLLSTWGSQLFIPLLTPAMQSFGPTTAVIATPLQILTPPLASLGTIRQYGIDTTGKILVLDNSNTPSTLNPTTLAVLPLPGIPALSFPRGIAFDAIRNRVLVSTISGGGTLYGFDVATMIWSTIASLTNMGPRAMVHDTGTDTIYGIDPGIFGGSNLALRRYSFLGAITSSTTLGLHTWGTGFDNFQLYALGANLIAIGPGKTLLGGTIVVRHTFVIEPASGDILCASFLLG